MSDQAINVDDIVETTNHFRCIDLVIDDAKNLLSEKMIKELHLILKNGTQDSRKEWFAVGDYKKVPNEVGGHDTALPEEVPEKMKNLLARYRKLNEKTLFKECLKYDIIPFIIDEDLKWYYYRGLSEWNRERGYLRDTCLTAQDKFKKYLDYFRIQHRD